MSSSPGSFVAAEAFSVRGQSVIVTGAAGAIGSVIAETFVANGAHVVLSDRDIPELAATASRLREQYGLETLAQPADLRELDQLGALVDAAVAANGRLDTVVHCGAIPLSQPLLEEDDDAFDRMFHTNLRSMWILARRAISHLKASQGSMINIASVNGHRALFPCSLYAGTKAGMIRMSTELAAEFGEALVRFNTISPGLIVRRSGWFEQVRGMLRPPHDQTLLEMFPPELHPKRRWGQPLATEGVPYDVAMAALYLASPAARFVTGADLLVDGAKLHAPDHQRRDPAAREFWQRLREHLNALPDDAWSEPKPDWLTRRRGS